MAKFEPDELLKKMRINKYATDMMIGKKEIPPGDGGIPNAPYQEPPLDPSKGPISPPPKRAALTQQQMDSLNKIFPGAEGRINEFRRRQFDMGPMKIKPQGPQLPDLASARLAWIKNVGDELTPQEVMDGLRIIDQTETNPLKKRRRLDRMMDNNPPLAMSPADVPLGDGMINDAKTKMQINLKQKYDMMTQEEYDKVMKRTMGTKKK